MILNTGNRTDIPAFYSRWFWNRLKDGFAMARNPMATGRITKFRLDPEVVDVLSFCTKNPAPMLAEMARQKAVWESGQSAGDNRTVADSESVAKASNHAADGAGHNLFAFRQMWHVTITPYGRDIEPYVPPKEDVMQSFRQLSELVGPQCTAWRYDPIFLSETYDIDFHLRTFEEMAQALEGATHQCIISFIDLYEKTKRNFPEARRLTAEEEAVLAKGIAASGARHGMKIYACCEDKALARYGIDVDGCMTKEGLESAFDITLDVPKGQQTSRPICKCLLGSDIGAYNTCGHGCRYCYANYDRRTVEINMAAHDPDSPLLVGWLQPEDIITDARQESYYSGQITMGF